MRKYFITILSIIVLISMNACGKQSDNIKKGKTESLISENNSNNSKYIEHYIAESVNVVGIDRYVLNIKTDITGNGVDETIKAENGHVYIDDIDYSAGIISSEKGYNYQANGVNNEYDISDMYIVKFDNGDRLFQFESAFYGYSEFFRYDSHSKELEVVMPCGDFNENNCTFDGSDVFTCNYNTTYPVDCSGLIKVEYHEGSAILAEDYCNKNGNSDYMRKGSNMLNLSKIIYSVDNVLLRTDKSDDSEQVNIQSKTLITSKIAPNGWVMMTSTDGECGWIKTENIFSEFEDYFECISGKES